MSNLQETSAVAVAPKVGRSRDNAANRESLRQAAQELFGQRGFERMPRPCFGRAPGRLDI